MIRSQNATPCPASNDGWHAMISGGYDPRYCGEILRCACGFSALAGTDELKVRLA
jgi:hypothetical protein